MNEIEVNLGSYLDVIALERIFKANYKKALRSELVRFRAQSLTGSNLFALGLVLLWAKRLRNRGVAVQFDLGSPHGKKNDKTFRFKILLYRWRFIDALKDAGVNVEHSSEEAEGLTAIEPSQKAVVGLHFFRQFDDVTKFLTTVADREEELFGPTAQLELIGSGSLRNIILQELLLNVFEHGKGISGFTAMCENVSPSELPTIAREIIASAPIWEQPFLRTLKTTAYLEVVVADHGPGIMSTLSDTWDRDDDRPEHHSTKELNIIEYAFHKYASCKADPDSYLHDALQRAHGGEQRTTTGLYFVKSIAASHGALLSIRSGASWLAWDFSSSFNPKAITHKADRRLLSLERFGGVQYRLLFPLGKPNRAESLPSAGASISSAPRRSQAQTLRLGGALPLSTDTLSGEVEGESFRELAQTIRSYYREIPLKSWFVVILSGGLPSKRHALVILYILANLQKEDRPVLLLLLGETATIVRAASLDIKLEGDELPVLCVDATLSPFFAGGPSAEEFFKRENPGDGRSRLDHIVYWDAEEGAYRLRLLSLESIVLDALVQYFKTWTAKPPKGIKAEGHFLLPTPSNAYCAVFWDINEVLGSKEKLAAAALGFAIYILRAKPNRVIALSFNAGRIAREALRWLGSDRDFRAQLQVVSDPHSQQSFLSVHGGALEGSWLVVTDVIGTTKVLTNALDMLGGKNISGVLAVVDAREPDSADFVRTGVGDVPLRSLLREPQVYYRDLPAGWFYPSIQTIDRILHRPISTHRPDLSPSLWGDDLAKTLMQCASCGALACGHFSSGTKHFSTFILTSRLIRRFVDDIVGAINMQLARAAES